MLSMSLPQNVGAGASVTVDDRQLPTVEMGLSTVGHVLSHLQKSNRMVVHVLIDGHEPDTTDMDAVRAAPLAGRTIYIETAEPRAMALEVIESVTAQVGDADALRTEAADLLSKGEHSKAMSMLGGCFTVWHAAQQSLVNIAQLLRIDLNRLEVDGQPLSSVISDLSTQLRNVKDALQGRDFVLLSDILTYEMNETTLRWRAALAAIRRIVEG